ncbi:hypothetical protein AMTR_s00004p00245150 [Amborella trichopoda]|uniref:Uncharacterized protein n=1 Tax=Amborella trichopoda TaxID=13333 RepID=W1NEB9_AMBTC|nr:hypothetical protein AMTR_s00004p00245150 [Amborella trichopoda]
MHQPDYLKVLQIPEVLTTPVLEKEGDDATLTSQAYHIKDSHKGPCTFQPSGFTSETQEVAGQISSRSNRLLDAEVIPRWALYSLESPSNYEEELTVEEVVLQEPQVMTGVNQIDQESASKETK